MRPISEIKANYRLRIVSSGEDGFAAYINHPWKKIGEEYETPPKEYVG